MRLPITEKVAEVRMLSFKRVKASTIPIAAWVTFRIQRVPFSGRMPFIGCRIIPGVLDKF
jgi:hypothetical protein